MEVKKFNVAALILVFGLILMLGIGNVKEVNAKICPRICFADLDYMTCPSTGLKKLAPSCSCCVAPSKGCIIYFTNGNKPVVC